MTGRVEKTFLALRDVDEIATFLQRRSGPQRAIRFLHEAERTFTRLAGMTDIGALYDPGTPGLGDLRYFPVSRYRSYLVFYRPIPGGIEVVRVLHGARDLHGLLAADAEVDDEG